MAGYRKEVIRFPSADGASQTAGYFFTPEETPVRALLQLSHGMCEYVCRYEPMFATLCQAGIACCGNDHLGHGDTSPHSLGFAAETDGQKLILADLYQMNQLAHEKYPGVPCFLLGHSMGSFYARWLAEVHGDAIDGLILSGTGGPSPLMALGRMTSGVLAKLRGPKYISKVMVNASTGSYCKGIPDRTSPSVWLSRDPAVWAAYDADPKCTFSFTVSAYHDMLTVHTHVNRPAWARSLRKDLPIYIYSGDQDPVGNWGKGVQTVYDRLRAAGMEDVSLTLYPGGRHEMHNEINRDEVLSNLLDWIKSHC